MLRVGFSLLVGAGFLLLLSLRVFYEHNWTPVRMPLTLSASQVTRAEFVADMDTIYFVQVDLKRNLPFDKLEAIGQPPVEWTVKQGNRSIGQLYSGRYWGETIGYEVGRFKGTAGQKYRIEARVKHDAPAFQILDPHLEIAINPVDFEMAYIYSTSLVYLSILVFLISVSCLAYGWRAARNRTVTERTTMRHFDKTAPPAL